MRIWTHSSYETGKAIHYVHLDDEIVYTTKSRYKRDMFMAELKARVKNLTPREDKE